MKVSAQLGALGTDYNRPCSLLWSSLVQLLVFYPVQCLTWIPQLSAAKAKKKKNSWEIAKVFLALEFWTWIAAKTQAAFSWAFWDLWALFIAGMWLWGRFLLLAAWFAGFWFCCCYSFLFSTGKFSSVAGDVLSWKDCCGTKWLHLQLRHLKIIVTEINKYYHSKHMTKYT